MNPALNGSEPLDLQDVTPNSAAELRAPRQRAPNPSETGCEPAQKLLGLQWSVLTHIKFTITAHVVESN